MTQYRVKFVREEFLYTNVFAETIEEAYEIAQEIDEFDLEESGITDLTCIDAEEIKL
jgi:hypothetical protein